VLGFLITTTRASGYASRDLQGGTAMKAFQ